MECSNLKNKNKTKTKTKTKIKKMQFFTARNFHFSANDKKVVLQRPSILLAPGVVGIPDFMNEAVNNFFANATTAQIAFFDGAREDVCLVFLLHKEGFLDFDEDQSHFEGPLDAYPMHALFTFVFQTLPSVFCTHIRVPARWVKGDKRNVMAQIIAQCAIAQYAPSPVYIAVDSEYVTRATAFFPRRAWSNFVFYFQKKDVPKQLLKFLELRPDPPAPLETETVNYVAERSVYLHRNNLNAYRDRIKILEGPQCMQWNTSTARSATRARKLQRYYHEAFVAIFSFYGTAVERLALEYLIAAIESELSARTAPVLNTMINNIIPILIKYFSTYFASKYKFLFVWSQIWRLRHWISLHALI